MDENLELIEPAAPDFSELTTSLVAAYVSHNHVAPGEIGALIARTHAALIGLAHVGVTEAPAAQKSSPGQIRKSITSNALISFIDGKPYKTLKRHLTRNGLTIEQYRERYGLPRDYPSTASSYSEQRSALAKSLGLGSQRKKPAPQAAEAPEPASEKPKRVGRPRKEP